jgi:hypothetical protein
MRLVDENTPIELLLFSVTSFDAMELDKWLHETLKVIDIHLTCSIAQGFTWTRMCFDEEAIYARAHCSSGQSA